YIYNPKVEERYSFVLQLMYEQGFISLEELEDGLAIDLKTKLNPGKFYNDNIDNFFVETCQNQVIEDLVEQKGISVEQANNLLLTSGFTIHSTLIEEEQQFLQRQYMEEGSEEFFNAALTSSLSQFQAYHDLYDDGIMGEDTWQLLIDRGYFPTSINRLQLSQGDEHRYVADIKRAVASEGFAPIHPWISYLSPTFSYGRIVLSDGYLYDYKSSFDQSSNFLLPIDYFYQTDEGDIRVPDNGLLMFQETEGGYIYLGLGDMYHFGNNPQTREYKYDGKYTLPYFLLFENGSLTIPNDYLAISNDELVISRSAFDDDVIFINDFGELAVSNEYVLKSTMPVVQPQSASAIIDESTGHLKAIFGGRGVLGHQLLNRALTPAQTGSAIKPLAVYGPGIDSGILTAAETALDKPSYQFNTASNEPWPVNFSGTYEGPMTVRRALTISQNVPAVTFASMIGYELIADYLEANGITTIVREGAYNDLGPSALALGGLTLGISPVEMASAYGTFGNEGVHMPWISYTHVEDDEGNIILDNRNHQGNRVFSPEANYIMTDLLNDVVTKTSFEAIIGGGIPVIGKTGTTGARKANTDAWFVGVTPYLSCSIWVGTDRNVSLTEGSWYVAQYWGKMMKDYHANLPSAYFAPKPDGVGWLTVDARSGKLPGPYSKNTITELFILGTAPTEVDDSYEAHIVCKVSGKAPTEYCEETEEEIFLKKEYAVTEADKAQVFDPDDQCEICEKEAKEKKAEEEAEREEAEREEAEKEEAETEGNENGG
ncbi:MAG TPA: penicillin-binding transpeptidase domain-containing protein, partial [Clostridia bacterium]|nr:penicillin-binding transpeptidase domain-containing protein [Clostridia bacterium]